MIAKIFTLLFLTNFATSKYFIMGPAKIILLKTDDCAEYKNLPMKSIFKLHMYNKTTQLMDVNVTFPVDLDETVSISLKSSRIDKSRVQQNAFTIEEEYACETLNRYVGSFWKNLQQKIGIVPGVCPMKKGEYYVRNLYLNLDELKVKMFLEGTFSTRIQFKQLNKVICCKQLELKLEPK